MENVDMIESYRASNKTDGVRNILNSNLRWFELRILLQWFIMYIDIK